MRALHTLSILGISPVLQCSACRTIPVFSPQLVEQQCATQWHSAPKRGAGFGPSPQIRASSTISNASFTYRVAASFTGKGRRFDAKNDTYTYLPDQEALEGPFTGRPNSGQDAFFISKVGSTNNMAFGVADGVGGWSDSGFDSAHFSHGLCQWMAQSAEVMDAPNAKKVGPRGLLDRAYKGIIASKKIAGGGSTACVAIGREDGTLSVANLGDSGFVQLRQNTVHYTSNPQTHAFNTPYQLSIVPPRILALSRAFGGGPLHDFPSDAALSKHTVQHGDILIFATDGVWDNLTPQDILTLTSTQMLRSKAWLHPSPSSSTSNTPIDTSNKLHNLTISAKSDSIQAKLASIIAQHAKITSEDTQRDGPFAREVQRQYPQEGWQGGKVDDICVVVAVVLQS